MPHNNEIDYRILGEEIQCVEIGLDPTESAVAESGVMMTIEEDIRMQPIFSDDVQQRGVLDKSLSAGENVLAGEGLFITSFTNHGVSKRRITFAAPYPGKIIPLDLARLGGKMICQKSAFLCVTKGVSIGIEFRRKLGTGIFGGEGFVLKKLEGDGMCFVHSCGHIMQKELQQGEKLCIDSGCIVAFTQQIHYDIELAGGTRNTLFGDDGIFLATLTGPGTVWIQSLPISRLAERILRYASLKHKEENNIFG